MPVEDVFSIAGRGTVVTGRVEQVRHPPTHPPTHLHPLFIYLRIFPSIGRSFHLIIHPPTHPTTHPPTSFPQGKVKTGEEVEIVGLTAAPTKTTVTGK